MARSIQAIYDAIITEKESQSSLSGLNPNAGENAANLIAALSSGSKVAIWRLIFWTIAVSQWMEEVIYDLHVAYINSLIPNLITGPAAWYQAQALLFQYGYNLVYQNSQYIYATIDATAQIIFRAAAVDLPGLLKIKVAANDGSGNPIALTTPQLIAFTFYMNLKKFAGTNLQVISLSADYLQPIYTIVYDPLVLDGTGQSIASPGTYPVQDAIKAVLASLPFNGILDLTTLTNTILAASGVVNSVNEGTLARAASSGYVIADPINGYNPSSGYLVVDPTIAWNAMLTYEAETL